MQLFSIEIIAEKAVLHLVTHHLHKNSFHCFSLQPPAWHADVRPPSGRWKCRSAAQRALLRPPCSDRGKPCNEWADPCRRCRPGVPPPCSAHQRRNSGHPESWPSDHTPFRWYIKTPSGFPLNGVWKRFCMVSLNLPPAPLRKGNIQAVDLHHSIGLSATPSSLWPGRELRKYHCLEVPEAAYSIFKVRRLRFPFPLGPGPFPWHDCIVLSQKSLWTCSPSCPPS